MYEGKKIEDFSQDLLNMLSLFFYTKIEKANTLNTVKKKHPHRKFKWDASKLATSSIINQAI